MKCLPQRNFFCKFLLLIAIQCQIFSSDNILDEERISTCFVKLDSCINRIGDCLPERVKEYSRFFVKISVIGLNLATGILAFQEGDQCLQVSELTGGCTATTVYMSAAATILSVLDTTVDWYKAGKFGKTLREFQKIYAKIKDTHSFKEKLTVCEKLATGMFFSNEPEEKHWFSWYRTAYKCLTVGVTASGLVSSAIANKVDGDNHQRAILEEEVFGITACSLKALEWVYDVFNFRHGLLKDVKEKAKIAQYKETPLKT